MRDAVALIEKAVGARTGVWADIGAGTGTFTRALAILIGPKSTIYAVDSDLQAIAALQGWSAPSAAGVIPVHADFTRSLKLPLADSTLLDGMLLANALHFVSDAESVLSQLVALVRPGGRVVVVEYERRAASRWVPYPISMARLTQLAAGAGLSTPVVTATRPSEYSGVLYAASADRP